jgi:hypothetical protein
MNQDSVQIIPAEIYFGKLYVQMSRYVELGPERKESV